MSDFEPTPPAGDPEALLARGATFDFGTCFNAGFELYKKNFGIFLAATLVVLIIQGVIQVPGSIGNQMIETTLNSRGDDVSALATGMAAIGGLLALLSGILSMLFNGALYGGLMKFMLRFKHGETPDFPKVFEGFGPQLLQLMLAGVVTSILTFIGFLLCILPGIYLLVGYAFTFILIVDKKMNFWDAMELSRKMVTKNWFMVFLYLLVVGLVGAAGFIACCVGVIVTMPFAVAAAVCLYDQLFGEVPPALESGV